MPTSNTEIAITHKIPLRGYVVVWVIVILVLLLGIVELIYQVRGRHIL